MKKNRFVFFKEWDTRRRLLCLLCILSCCSFAALGQKRVDGTVVDETDEPLAGATITVKSSTRGVITDADGKFGITVNAADALEISYLGYETQTVAVGQQTYISVKLEPKKNELDEVIVVAFGKQKKVSVISAIQTVDTKDLHVPSSNLTTAFAGRIAGMISYQTSGEPGNDNASFFIRGVTTFGAGKVDPLILVDNVEVTTSDLANLHPDDLQSFSILKDATATALYGARGANGVILISTKEGKEGKPQVSVRIENSFSSPTSTIKMADPITYMQLANEAVTTRDPMKMTPYSKSKIDNTLRGTDPYAYPSMDWMNMLIKDVASNQRANLSISGGGKVARYYVAGSFAQDNGIFKVDKRNNFNNNIRYEKYLLHSNININVTNSTEMIVRLHGTFNDYQGPLTGGSEFYKRILKVSPVRFPAYYEPDELYSKTNHILFGGSSTANYLNPYAEMLKGYKTTSNSTMMAQIELKQDFGQWIEGLSARVMGNTSRYADFDQSMQYSPFYYEMLGYNRQTGKYSLFEINPTSGTEYLQYAPGAKNINYNLYGEGSVSYSRNLGDLHEISGMLVGQIRQSVTANATTLAAALPSRNLGLSGRFTYGYGSRYFGEFNFGYNGSEKFDKGHRWGFFPSFGVGWTVSNESFWEPLKQTVSLLKIRGTYGLVGNDAILDEKEQRFFYISEVKPGGGGSFSTGYNVDAPGLNLSGYSIVNYPNSNITWEVSRKSNLGIELGLMKDLLMIQVDLFREHRSNILQSRADIVWEQGLWGTPWVNIGTANSKGIDLSVDYKQFIGKDLWVVGRGNFTYARSTFDYYEEIPYAEIGAPWRMHKGRSVSQSWGYIAERLFIDDYDVATSARQEFGEYEAGDIKYRDLNSDGVINELDMAPIGYPQTPEINYGFGLSAGYKGFDLSFFFSGSDRSSFYVNATDMSPFVTSTVEGRTVEGGLAKYIADDHWTEQAQNPYARWPRLSNTVVANNVQQSTWNLYDNHFLRLKSAEAGYALPGKLLQKLRLQQLRLYVSGTNLALFSNFKLWDVEMGGKGMNYPLQRVVNVGLNVTF
ncbi:MAG: TonB-dependent receptor [Tannerella sp.]|jgi:TonB-linked SusC/RagA family outer membrane protein|nr:TonB-dependent receptor [Tannerella sp.]